MLSLIYFLVLFRPVQMLKRQANLTNSLSTRFSVVRRWKKKPFANWRSILWKTIFSHEWFSGVLMDGCLRRQKPHLLFILQTISGIQLGVESFIRGDQAVVPVNLRQRILQVGHEGHPGIVKMRQRLRNCVRWPGMDSDVDKHIKHCKSCLRSDKSARFVTTPLQSIPLSLRLWHTMALNIQSKLHGASFKWRYLIVAYDLHSKWPEV